MFLSLFSISSPSLLLALPLPSAVREMCVGSIVIGIDVPLSETCKSHLKSAWWRTVGKRVGCLLFCSLSLSLYLSLSLSRFLSPLCLLFPPVPPLPPLFLSFAVLFFTLSLLPASCHLKRSSISGGTSPSATPFVCPFSVYHTHSPPPLFSSVFLSLSFLFYLGTHSFPPTLDILSKWFQVSGPQASSNRRAYTYTHNA